MTYPAHFSRPLVLRAKRDTITLVVAATAMTFALSYAVHSHRGRDASGVAPQQQPWTGDLADAPASQPLPEVAEPVTSASLVVPKAELALPQPSVRPLVKLRGCAGQSCVAKTPAAAVAARKPSEETSVVARPATPTLHRAPPSLMARLNPLNHLPDPTAMKRPFTYAGDTVSGWFKRF